MLTLLTEDYEVKYHPLPRVSPNELLKALMGERGLKHKDIWPVLGNKGAATVYQQGSGEAACGVFSGASRAFYSTSDLGWAITMQLK